MKVTYDRKRAVKRVLLKTMAAVVKDSEAQRPERQDQDTWINTVWAIRVTRI